MNSKTAIFAGGCFWCMEAVYKNIKGILSVAPGYIGGETKKPTYEQVKTGDTGHAEAIRIMYNPNIVSYEDLLRIFFATHNPTTLNRQGNDFGPQYRSGIFYMSDEQKKLAEAYIKYLNEQDIFDRFIVTEILPATKFYEAEDYHHNYFKNNPNNPYCQFVIIPKVEKFKSQFKKYLKDE